MRGEGWPLLYQVADEMSNIGTEVELRRIVGSSWRETERVQGAVELTSEELTNVMLAMPRALPVAGSVGIEMSATCGGRGGSGVRERLGKKREKKGLSHHKGGAVPHARGQSLIFGGGWRGATNTS